MKHKSAATASRDLIFMIDFLSFQDRMHLIKTRSESASHDIPYRIKEAWWCEFEKLPMHVEAEEKVIRLGSGARARGQGRCFCGSHMTYVYSQWGRELFPDDVMPSERCGR